MSGHGDLDPLVDPGLHGLGHGIEQTVENLALLTSEDVEHVVAEIVEARWARAHADPEPGVVLAAEHPLDALQPVMPAGGSRAPQPESTQRQGDFVHQNQQIAAGIEAGKVQ